MGTKFPKSNFKPAPKGLHMAVCCDFVDCGIIDKTFKNKTKKVHCVQYRFQSSKINPDNGKPWLILTSRMTLSSDQRASLRKMLESWRGEAFTKDGLDSFELDSMIGEMAQIQIVHNEADNGNTYANIGGILPVPEGAKQLMVMDYVRVCDREDENAATPGTDGFEEAGPDVGDGDNIPF